MSPIRGIDCLKTWIFTSWTNIRQFVREYPQVSLYWVIIAAISVTVAAVTTFFSNQATRENAVRPLLIGVITLFTISLTVAIMGIRVASNRYSHRVDSTVLKKRAIWLHFLPHLVAILFAVCLITTGQYVYWAFFIFILSISAAILSIFPLLQWLLTSLSPQMMVSTSIQRIDQDFIDRVEEVVREERKEVFQSSDRYRILSIFRSVSYLNISEDDPIDMFTDIVLSRILSNDTETVTNLLDRYSEHVDSVLKFRYKKFETSHSDSQLVAWYLFSPLEDTYRIAVKEDDPRIPENVISMLRASIESWTESTSKGVPEVFFRIFGSITVEYVSKCDAGQAKEIARDYSRIANVVASDIDSPGHEISGAMSMNFVGYSLDFAVSSINEGYYEPAAVINRGLRRIVEAKLRHPSSDPDRTLLMMGLIGEQFAVEQAKSKNIVEIANEVSVRDRAEWTVTNLVTFKDKIEEYGNGYAYKKYLGSVMREIDRVNEALEEKDRQIASKLDHNEDLVVEIIRGGRLFRSPFSVDELVSELNISVSKDEIEEICEDLQAAGALESRENEQYMKSYDNF